MLCVGFGDNIEADTRWESNMHAVIISLVDDTNLPFDKWSLLLKFFTTHIEK